MSKSQLAASYAALLLQDGDIEITSDKIAEVLKAANVTGVESYWGSLMCKVFAEKNVDTLLIEGGAGAAAAAIRSVCTTTTTSPSSMSSTTVQRRCVQVDRVSSTGGGTSCEVRRMHAPARP